MEMQNYTLYPSQDMRKIKLMGEISLRGESLVLTISFSPVQVRRLADTATKVIIHSNYHQFHV